MPEQLTFQQGFRQGRTVDGYKRLVPPLTARMNIPGNQFLAGAGFPMDQNRSPAVTDFPGGSQKMLHSLIPRDYGKPVRTPVIRPGFWVDLRPDNVLHHVDLDRLDKKIRSTGFHGSNCGFGFCTFNRHDHRNKRMTVLDLPQQP